MKKWLVGVSLAAIAWAAFETYQVSVLRDRIDELEHGAARRTAEAQVAIQKGDFTRAITILSEVAQSHPDAAAAQSFLELQNIATSALAEQTTKKELEDEAQRQRSLSRGLVAWKAAPTGELPSGFQGTDIQSLYSIMSNMAGKPKDNFESEEEYKRRLRAAFSNGKIGIYDTGDTFVFSSSSPLRGCFKSLRHHH